MAEASELAAVASEVFQVDRACAIVEADVALLAALGIDQPLDARRRRPELLAAERVQHQHVELGGAQQVHPGLKLGERKEQVGNQDSLARPAQAAQMRSECVLQRESATGMLALEECSRLAHAPAPEVERRGVVVVGLQAMQ